MRQGRALAATSALALLLSGCATTFPLEQAARMGQSAEVQSLLNQGADVNQVNSFTRETALIAAAKAGHLDVVKTLLNDGADIQARDMYGRTALMMAAAGGHAPVVSLLLDRGATVLTSDASGKTPLMLASESGDAKTVRLLRDAQSKAQAEASQEAIWRPGSPETVLVSPAPAAGPQNQAPAESLEPSSDVDAPSFSASRERADDFAVVIGVEKYGLFQSRALYAERDARSAGLYFRALGVPARHIMTLLGSRATKGLIQSRLERWLADNAKPDSRIYVYFSGHGAPDPQTKKAYLVPYDGDPNDLSDTAYPVDRLYASLNSLKSKQVLVFLDSCFSGEGGRSVLAPGARPLVTVLVGSPSGSVKAMTAAGRNQITSDMPGKGHGLFTYYMLKGLDGAARDSSGRVTMKSLYRYLKPRVEDEARLKFRTQDPQLLPEGWSGDWILR